MYIDGLFGMFFIPRQIALRGLGVDAGPNVLMIGDTVDDIKAAISAG